MRKLFLGAIAAIAALGAISTADAATTFRGPSNPDGGSDVCTALCISVPPLRHRVLVKQEACTDKLHQLRRVTAAQIARVDENDVVHIVPLCDDLRRSLTQGQDVRLDIGNTQGLLPAIASNDVLGEGLSERGYRTGDVLGIAFGPGAAILYVSHR